MGTNELLTLVHSVEVGIRHPVPSSIAHGSLASCQSEFSFIEVIVHVGVTVEPSFLYPCMRLNCQYHPAEGSVASSTEVAWWSAPRLLVIQHFVSAPGIFVTVPYVTVLVTGATFPATWLMVREEPHVQKHVKVDSVNCVAMDCPQQTLYAHMYRVYGVLHVSPVSVFEKTNPIFTAVVKSFTVFQRYPSAPKT
jgi:hypothetical protein